MASAVSTTEDLRRAREHLQDWARKEALSDGLSEDIVIMLFRDWAAEHFSWYLRVHWRPGPDCYGARWHRDEEAPDHCEDQFSASDMHEVRVLACAGFLRDHAEAGK